MDNLRFIRETMQRSASFTHVSGIGGVLMGLIAIAAALIASRAAGPTEWVMTWLAAAVTSLAVATLSMARKSAAAGEGLLTGPGRKFAWNVIPPLAVGAVLTVVFIRAALLDQLPGAWLLLYGTGIMVQASSPVVRTPFGPFRSWVPRSWVWEPSLSLARPRGGTRSWPPASEACTSCSVL